MSMYERIVHRIEAIGIKLKPEFKKEWLEALRSGNYKQIDGALRCNANIPEIHTYCCLGVMCDLLAKKHEAAEWMGIDFIFGKGPIVDAFPPPNAVPYLFVEGTSSRDAREVYELLSELNDHGYSFLKIADVIEQTL